MITDLIDLLLFLAAVVFIVWLFEHGVPSLSSKDCEDEYDE